MPRDECRHGHLRRQCETCDLEAELATARRDTLEEAAQILEELIPELRRLAAKAPSTVEMIILRDRVMVLEVAAAAIRAKIGEE